MHSPEDRRHRAADLHGVDHARRRRGIGAARAARTDECIGVQQNGQPIEVQRQRQLGERRAVLEPRPPFTQVVGRHGPQEGHLQQQVHDGGERDRAENGERHAAPGIACFARKIHRALEAVVAEHDAAGRDGGQDGGKVADVRAAVDADVEVLPMKPGEHQSDGGGAGHDQLEERDRAVGVRKNLDAPEIDQEISNHQDRGDRQASHGQLPLTIRRMYVKRVRPVPRP